MPVLLKCPTMLSRRKVPMSLKRRFPDASRSPVAPTRSCPAPSATTMTAWPRLSSRERSRPSSRSMPNGISGMRQKLTSERASEAKTAMNPDSRPMSLTSPMPLRAPLASVCAASIALTASDTAVSNPNERSTNEMSLSIVLGMPTTPIFRPRLWISSADLLRPAQRPVAADGEEQADVHAVERVHDLPGVLVPARGAQDGAAVFVDAADGRRVQLDRGVAVAVGEALVAVGEPEDVAHPVVVVQAEHDCADHVVEPRAEAAAGDDAALELGGVEVDLRARPGLLEGRHRPGRLECLAQQHRVGLEHDLVAVLHEVHALDGGGDAAGPESLDFQLLQVGVHALAFPGWKRVVPSPRRSRTAWRTRAAMAASAAVR